MMTVSEDQAVKSLDLGSTDGVIAFVELLCGQKLAKPSDAASARAARRGAQIATGQPVGFREINELLILLGQNRISRGFFEVFFENDSPLPVADRLKAGLSRFRMWAMLCDGNFRHPFQEWRRLDSNQVKGCFGRFLHGRELLLKELLESKRTININRINESKTYTTGVIAAARVLQEFKVAMAVCDLVGVTVDVEFAKRTAVEGFLMTAEQPLTPARMTHEQIEHVKANIPTTKAEEIRDRLLEKLSDVASLRKQAIEHTEAYLLAEKLDVYVATSMREDWEFSETAENLFEIFEKGHEVLKHLDYFDPTQSFTASPVDKGLVEGLMLNRVSATVYMAQESDTMGKDSELAATLAQGKPVVAFVPRIVNTDSSRGSYKLTDDEEREVQRWCTRFRKRPMNFFRKRLFLLQGADILSDAALHNLCRENGLPKVADLSQQFWDAMNDFDPLFSLIPDEHDAFKAQHAWIDSFIRMFVLAEAVNFDKRATTLIKYHPLGIQIEMVSGTANGVLVVRDVPQCVELLEALMLNTIEFKIVEEEFGTALVESISKSRYRVVTKDPILTASFWNFFKPPRRARRVTTPPDVDAMPSPSTES